MVYNQQERNTYFIGGVSGVGKSTFLKNLEEVSDDFEIIYGSKYFMKWLGLKDGDYEALHQCPKILKTKSLIK